MRKSLQSDDDELMKQTDDFWINNIAASRMLDMSYVKAAVAKGLAK
jgi:hypothetical protein